MKYHLSYVYNTRWKSRLSNAIIHCTKLLDLHQGSLRDLPEEVKAWAKRLLWSYEIACEDQKSTKCDLIPSNCG